MTDKRTYTISPDAFGMIIQVLTSTNMSYHDLGIIVPKIGEQLKND